MIAKAARTVGSYGSIVIQTRQPNHRLLRACASSDVAGALEQLATEELATRRELNLPPYADVVRVSITDGRDISEAGEIPGIQVARDPKGYLLRGATWNDVNGAVMRLRSYFGTAVRINGDPLRY